MKRWPLNTPRASFRALCTKYSANDGAVTGSPAQGQQNMVCKGLADRGKFPGVEHLLSACASETQGS